MAFIEKLVFVAAGGALGAAARYLVNISPAASLFEHFPFPTFLINVTGSFLLGFALILFADKVPVSDNLRMFVMVGCLGAFTTFSTFEAELFGLVKDGFRLQALLYLIASVIVGFLGLAAGIALARRLPDM
jgi:fluoride exporter